MLVVVVELEMGVVIGVVIGGVVGTPKEEGNVVTHENAGGVVGTVGVVVAVIIGAAALMSKYGEKSDELSSCEFVEVASSAKGRTKGEETAVMFASVAARKHAGVPLCFVLVWLFVCCVQTACHEKWLSEKKIHFVLIPANSCGWVTKFHRKRR